MNPLQSARAYDSLTPQLRETEILVELARNISASLDLDAVLKRVTDGAKELCGADAAAIYLRKPASDAALISHRTGTRYEGYDAIRIEPGKGMGGQVLVTGRPFRTDHYAEDPRISKDYLDLIREEGYFACMVVPIRIGSRVEGLLYLGRRSLLPFTDRDEEVLKLLAGHAAFATQNARLFERAERRRKATESLAEVARLISQSLDLDEVGQRIADAVRVLLNTQSSTLFRLEPESEDLVAVAVAGDLGPSLGRNMVFPRGTAVAGLAVHERCPVSTSDLFADSRIIFTPELRTHLYEAPHRAVLSVPLLVEDRVIGVLGVGDRAGRVFEEEEISLLQSFADQAVLALENARLYAESQRRLEETRTLLAVSQAVGSSLDLSETLRRVAREMARALGADMVSAWLADPDGSVLRPLSGYHVPKHFLDPSLKFPIPLEGHRFLEEAWQSKSPVYSSDAPADPRIDRETFERLPHRSILFCPMVLKGEPIGGLFAIWWEQPHHFSPEELRLVEGISQQAALAVESAQLYAETERRRKAAESLAHVGRLISQSLEPEEVGRQIVNSLLGLLNARASILFRLEPASGNLVALALGGEVEPRLSENIVLPKGIGVAGLAVQERRPVATPDVLSDPRITVTPEVRARIIQGPGRALLAAPLIFKDVVIGALGVRDRAGRVFNTEETHLLQAFADQAAIALENSRLYA
ncbi:MAG: GAF domain-containing protein, partial [Candidatus Rokubacteria bacterium]|nr:GAF domain-containing protein [Candidatus Rokubacteria bacterium]